VRNGPFSSSAQLLLEFMLAAVAHCPRPRHWPMASTLQDGDQSWCNPRFFPATMVALAKQYLFFLNCPHSFADASGGFLCIRNAMTSTSCDHLAFLIEATKEANSSVFLADRFSAFGVQLVS
jgi:hypothetical protein